MRIGIAYDLKTENADDFDESQEEFDSPETIESIANVLRELGHEVQYLGNGRELLAMILVDPPDLVFNIAEGVGVARSREARVPAVLAMLGIPYTGSDPLTLSVTLDKDCAKRLVRSVGVNVPDSHLLRADQEVRDLLDSGSELTFPAVIKPAWEGSSKGIHDNCLVDDVPQLREVIREIRATQPQPILIEEFIAGDEFTVGVVGNDPPKVLGAMRIAPQDSSERFIYSLEAKRDYKKRVRYECPALVSEDEWAALSESAIEAYRVLGCQDMARIDFRCRDRVPYFLEANPLPGLSPVTGDLVILARAYETSHQELIGSIIESATKRHRLGGASSTRSRLERTG